MSEFGSVKGVCDRIFTLEVEHGLLDLEIEGVKVWQYLRMELYYAAAQKSGFFQLPHAEPPSRLKKAKKTLATLKNSLFKNPAFFQAPVDILVFDHERFKSFEGENVDIYTKFFIDELETQGKNYLVIERPYLGQHLKPCSPRRKYLDFAELYRFFGKRIFKRTISPEVLRRIGDLDQDLRTQLGLDVDFRKRFVDGIARFKCNYLIYTRLLKKLRPKQIFLVVSYGLQGDLIRAAKDLGIEVVEFQHGVFSPYHLGYSFPGRSRELDYFPDKFFSWGRFWSELMPMPIPREKVVDYGFEYFRRLRTRYAGTPKRNRQLVVLSQAALGPALAQRVLECAEDLQDFRVVYKLHPSEYDKWRRYEALRKLAEMNNVEVIDHDVDLYALLAQSPYQLGVFSTALFEGMGLGCKTVLLDLPGIEYMERVVADQHAVLHRDGDSLARSLALAQQLDENRAARAIWNL